MDDFMKYFSLISSGYLTDLVGDMLNSQHADSGESKSYPSEDMIFDVEYTVQDDSCDLLLEEN